MRRPAIVILLGLGLALGLVATADAQLDIYVQGFDTLTPAVDGVLNEELAVDGWLVFSTALDSSENPDVAYDGGPMGAPNQLPLIPDQLPPFDPSMSFRIQVAPAFSAVETGEPTTSGRNYLHIFSDYNNNGHSNGRTVAASVFQQRIPSLVDVGTTWTFAFDYRAATDPFGANDPESSATTLAFLRVLDPDANFAEIETNQLSTTAATTTFTAGSVSLEIAEAHIGKILQFGFESRATNDQPAGVYYDALSFDQDIGVGLEGDFDGDGDVDLTDLDRYIGNLGELAFGEFARLDLNNDGTVGSADFERHYRELVETSNGGRGTFPGDLNLDGSVDRLGDQFALLGNLGNSVTSWSQGDFDGDGFVSATDEALLIENLGQSNGGVDPGVPGVPEPGSLSLLMLAAIGVGLRRKTCQSHRS